MYTLHNNVLRPSQWVNFKVSSQEESFLKGSPCSSHFIFPTNVGNRRIRHKTTLKLNFLIDSKSIEEDVSQIQSRSMSDPTFPSKMVWLWFGLPLIDSDIGLSGRKYCPKMPKLSGIYIIFYYSGASCWIYKAQTFSSKSLRTQYVDGSKFWNQRCSNMRVRIIFFTFCVNKVWE